MNPRHTTIALLTALLAACGGEVGLDESELARVGEHVITVAAFEAEMDRLASYPGQFSAPEAREELLQAMIEEERLVQTALARGFDQDPEIRRAYRRMLTNRLRQTLAEEDLAGIVVSDEEVRAYFEANADAYARPERRRAAIIFRRAGEESGTLARLEQVREEALALGGATHFGQLALDHSEDQSSRYVGGAIGWLSQQAPERYRWGPEVVEALFALDAPGDVSEVVRTEDGYYLVRLMAVDAGSARGYDEVAAGIRRALLAERRREARARALDDYASDVRVEVNEQALAQLSVAAGEAPPRRDARPPALPGKVEGTNP